MFSNEEMLGLLKLVGQQASAIGQLNTHIKKLTEANTILQMKVTSFEAQMKERENGNSKTEHQSAK